MERLEERQQAPPAPGPRHGALLQVLITLVFVTAVFGGIEWVVRRREYSKLGPRALNPLALRDQFSAWRNNPAYWRVDRQINGQGFRRDKDVPPEKPNNTIRIFITGVPRPTGGPQGNRTSVLVFSAFTTIKPSVTIWSKG